MSDPLRMGGFHGFEGALEATQEENKIFPGSWNTWSGRAINSSCVTGSLVGVAAGIAAFVFACQLVHLGNGQSLKSLLMAKKMSIAYGVMLGGALLQVPGAITTATQNPKEITGKSSAVIFASLFLTLSVLASRGVISPYKFGLAAVVIHSVALGAMTLILAGACCVGCAMGVAMRD